MKAIRIHAPGGVEALRFEDVPEPEPKPGEARVRVEAAGVNFIDVYHRTGLYKATLPATLGQEGAGLVETVGDGVTEVRPGDRVEVSGAKRPFRIYRSDQSYFEILREKLRWG